jgi:GntR family transcriptional regulator
MRGRCRSGSRSRIAFALRSNMASFAQVMPSLRKPASTSALASVGQRHEPRLTSPRVEQPLNLLASFSEDMRRRGLRPSYLTQSVDYAPVTAEVTEALGVSPSEQVFRTIRLFKADDEPMGVCESWIAPAALGSHTPPTAAELDQGSLYAWLERHCDVRIVGGHEFIEAANATRQQAQDLGTTAGAALLVIRRRSHAVDGKPIEYAIMRYRADRYRFRIDLVRQ